ncbi:MAG: FadR family transcriptional regulator [bacterium]|nr:FadR family transcriptional regulator [bacterium]
MKKPVVSKIQRKSVVSQVYGQLKHNIVNGTWIAGDKIPSENELVKMLGVSRISIREALKQLVSLGLLEARQGEGTFVKRVEIDSHMNELLPLMVLRREDILELIKYREIIEVGTVDLAVERADETDILALEENIRAHEKFQNSHKKAAQLDLEFHLLLAKASKNPFLIKANSLMKDVFHAVMERIVKEMGTEHGLYYHKKLIAAMKAHDKELAVSIMREHLVDTEKAME